MVRVPARRGAPGRGALGRQALGIVTLETPWPAPAKLNLFLHVTGRRVDGRHDLQTVFQFIDYCDTLNFTATRDGRIRRRRAIPGVPEGDDLCLRAARLLQARCGSGQGVEIDLRKRIPLGGGLGGGSSDAATTLHALNRLWGLGLPAGALCELGLELGADVPFFVQGHAAWAEGVGERLQAIDLPEPWYVVVVPPVPVSTGAVFAALADCHGAPRGRLTRYRPPITIRAFRAGAGGNDLEPEVRRRYPEVDRALAWLASFGPARMTGSGGCIFLAVSDAEQGASILAQLPGSCTGFVVRGLNRSPLLGCVPA